MKLLEEDLEAASQKRNQTQPYPTVILWDIIQKFRKIKLGWPNINQNLL